MTQLRTTELDFDTIKENLKAFLASKPEFTDYDFEGSGLSVIMNLLAYNTHYAAMLANLQTADLFLDTATKLSTVALSAKRLGYTPKSKRSAFATIDLEIFTGNNTPASLTIGRGAEFTASYAGDTFTFLTQDAMTVNRSASGRYVFSDLVIREGAINQFRYQYSAANPTKFVIPTKDVDIDTLSVKVQVSGSNSTTTVWYKNVSIADNTKTSKAFYVKMNRDGLYEVEFGDGIISSGLVDGNIVILEYFISSGAAANGIAYFNFVDTVEGYASNLITVKNASSGGNAIETIESIKKNAQQSVMAQNRAVNESDFNSAIRDIYPYDDISVWGGEKNVPPEFGRVFIAIKPANGIEFISDRTKEEISDALAKRKSIVTSKIKFVDPDYVRMIVSSTVYFSDTETAYSGNSIEVLVKEKIRAYATENIGKFGSSFSMSKLSAAIDSVGPYIKSNITKIKLRKEISILSLAAIPVSISFNNPLVKSNSVESNIKSNWFKINGYTENMYIDDDSNGTLRVYYYDGAVKKILISNVGTVDYVTGEMTIKRIDIIASENGTTLDIIATPLSNDVISIRNNILALSDADISVASKINQADITKHVFTASR